MATKLPYVLPFEDGSVVAAILLKAQGLPETEQIATKTELQQATAYLATLDSSTMAPQSATVKRTTDSLQAQIDNIVRAPESGGDVGAEVYQARVGVDGTNYLTLEARLNAEQTETQEQLVELNDTLDDYDKVLGSIGFTDTVNLCDPNKTVSGKYVDGTYGHVGDAVAIRDNVAFAYVKIPVQNGITYSVSLNSHALIIADANDIVLQIYKSGETHVTVNSATAAWLYVSFRFATVPIDKYMVVASAELPATFIPYLDDLHFRYPCRYAEASELVPIKQQVAQQEVGYSLLSYTPTVNLFDPTKAIDGKYIGAQYDHVGNILVVHDNAAFAYSRIEIVNGHTYTVSKNSYRLIVADENDRVLQILGETYNSITVSDPNAKYLYVNFRTATVPIDRYMVVDGSVLPQSFVPHFIDVGFAYPSKYDTKEYIVDINGTGDFTSFTDCLKQLKDDATPKTIKILSGTYNIFEEYGGAAFMADVDVSAGWRANSVLVPKNTHIIGIGQVILSWTPSATDIIDDAHANLFSPINLSDDNIVLENLDIVCSNGRYCIHDECGVRWEAATKDFQKSTHKYINIRATRLPKARGNVQVYGGGNSGEGPYIFENCVFKSPLTNVWSTHTNSNNVQGTGGCNFTFNNCIFDTDTPDGGTVRLINGATFKNKNNVHFNNCYINGDLKIMYSGSEPVSDRIQTYAVTLLKSTYTSIILDTSEFGNLPYPPAIYS